ncbi:hypothetical protein J1N35_010230 [Gossypium stocksii]|uniref:Uncharacterized protein n=1 Tax=Gossypium stocksii TaxID=47602 RepID=A0A9D3W0L8_9ROSI|nr:hypothetical protein J1N35_010230 [Gossypium stocksii]
MSVAHAGMFNETSPGLCGLLAAWLSSPSHNKDRKVLLAIQAWRLINWLIWDTQGKKWCHKVDS